MQYNAAKGVKFMKKMALFIFLSLILFSEISYSQGTFFKNYDGIPIIANLWGREHNLFSGYNYQDIQDAGIDAVISANMTQKLYDSLKLKTKIIPYQEFEGNREGLVYYSERTHTLWETEDTLAGRLTLNRNNVFFMSENDILGNPIVYAQSNISYRDTIISGPSHYNQLKRTLKQGNLIVYNAHFRLKLVNKFNNSLNSLITNSNIIGKIKVISHFVDDKKVHQYHVLAEEILTDSLFVSLNNWITISLIYNTPTDNSPEAVLEIPKQHSEGEHWEIIPNVEFKIIWDGSDTLGLCIDYVELYDTDGKSLVTGDAVVLNKISADVNYQNDPFMSDDHIVGWYPIDEPNCIDNMSCVKKVTEIVQSFKPNNKVIPSIAGAWNGMLDSGSDISKIDEFYRRAGYKGAKIHAYLYNYPYKSNEDDYKRKNTQNLLYHLDRARLNDTAFISSIQTGKWDVQNNGLLNQTPTPSQFLYNINTALLYGAKCIEMSNYYYYFGGENLRTALIGVSENGTTTNITYSELWYVLKNEVSPRLHGDYGKLLRRLKLDTLYNFTDASEVTLGHTTFYKTSSSADYECGVFENIEDKRVLMAISRWTNEIPLEDPYRVWFECNDLDENNYTVYDYYIDSTHNVYTTNNKITIERFLEPGDAFLYEIRPALKYGGKVVTNDVVRLDRELLGNLEVLSNKALSVIDTCTYTISGELYARNGSSICSDHKGDIIFSGSGKYKHETWGNSLFYLAKEGHPKLIWGSLQGNQTYGVYRKSGTTYLLIATIYSTDNNIKQTYIDSSITIYNGQLAGTEVYYKISRISGGRTYFTNEVSVTISNQSMEKQNVFIKEFAIEQNYPNPFNGMTSIKYMIPENGIVKIKIFDILGREIKVFDEGEKGIGMYEFKFNSGELSSGIYIYSVQYNNKILSKKMLLMK